MLSGPGVVFFESWATDRSSLKLAPHGTAHFAKIAFGLVGSR